MNSIADSNSDNLDRPEPGIAMVAGLNSVRVARIAQFLPKHERDVLFDAVCENQEAFQRIGNPNSPKEQGALYLTLESEGDDDPGFGAVHDAGLVQAAAEPLSKRILELLPALFSVLDVDPFPVSKIPLTLMNGRDGHSGSPHTDESGGRFEISLLYYFHKTPKVFRGGDLQFYEADPTSPSCHRENPLSTIAQEDNLLIAFPSEQFHGITDVQCDSGDFEDGRFAAIGFLGPQ